MTSLIPHGMPLPTTAERVNDLCFPHRPDYIRVAEPPPVVLAYGIGVDSTALFCGESISSHTSGGFLRH